MTLKVLPHILGRVDAVLNGDMQFLLLLVSILWCVVLCLSVLSMAETGREVFCHKAPLSGLTIQPILVHYMQCNLSQIFLISALPLFYSFSPKVTISLNCKLYVMQFKL